MRSIILGFRFFNCPAFLSSRVMLPMASNTTTTNSITDITPARGHARKLGRSRLSDDENVDADLFQRHGGIAIEAACFVPWVHHVRFKQWLIYVVQYVSPFTDCLGYSAYSLVVTQIALIEYLFDKELVLQACIHLFWIYETLTHSVIFLNSDMNANHQNRCGMAIH